MFDGTRTRPRAPAAIFSFVAVLATFGCSDSPVRPDGTPLLSRGQGDVTGGESELRGAQRYRATALFEQVRSATWADRTWDVEVVVTETDGKEDSATLWFRYAVRDDEGLFYTELYPSCEGRPCPDGHLTPLPIDPDDFTIQPGVRWATLDTEVPVSDAESGTDGTVHLEVRWDRERSEAVTASLEIEITTGSFPHVEDLPASTLVEAELTRLAPEAPEWQGEGTTGAATAEWSVVRPFHELGYEADWAFEAEVAVTEMLEPEPGASLWLRYSMDALGGTFRSVMETTSPVPIDPEDITIHPGLQWATVDTEVPVTESVDGTSHTARIRVTWDRARGGAVVASLELDIQYRPHPDLGPSDLVEAELTRSVP